MILRLLLVGMLWGGVCSASFYIKCTEILENFPAGRLSREDCLRILELPPHQQAYVVSRLKPVQTWDFQDFLLESAPIPPAVFSLILNLAKHSNYEKVVHLWITRISKQAQEIGGTPEGLAFLKRVITETAGWHPFLKRLENEESNLLIMELLPHLKRVLNRPPPGVSDKWKAPFELLTPFERDRMHIDATTFFKRTVSTSNGKEWIMRELGIDATAPNCLLEILLEGRLGGVEWKAIAFEVLHQRQDVNAMWLKLKWLTSSSGIDSAIAQKVRDQLFEQGWVARDASSGKLRRGRQYNEVVTTLLEVAMLQADSTKWDVDGAIRHLREMLHKPIVYWAIKMSLYDSQSINLRENVFEVLKGKLRKDRDSDYVPDLVFEFYTYLIHYSPFWGGKDRSFPEWLQKEISHLRQRN